MKNYYIGLNIDDKYVSWVATDNNYNILKAKGKSLWGINMFKEALPASDRSVLRRSRRRNKRAKERINLLNSFFENEIAKVDKTFFERLKESKYKLEDKLVDEKNILFADKNYKDKDFLEKYPTFYHLRKNLIESNTKPDIREVYLACHHILKNRGHFYFKGNINECKQDLNALIIKIINQVDMELPSNKETCSVSDVKSIIIDTSKSIRSKSDDLKLLLKNKAYISIFSLALGKKETLKNIFQDDEYDDVDERYKKISFNENSYEEVRDEYIDILGERINLIDSAYELYNSLMLNKIMPDGFSISNAKVNSYMKHQEDLANLKSLAKHIDELNRLKRKNESSLYYRIFDEDTEKSANYVSYSGNSKNGKKCNREKFYAFLNAELKNELENISFNILREDILNDIALESFMPLQSTKENSVIPHQINLLELKAILENAKKYYSFLNEKDDTGLSIEDKIIKTMTFTVPYYIGPLNTYHNTGENAGKGIAWAVRKSNDKVYPWNLKEVIDETKTAENFILNMVGRCSYLPNEQVMPRESLKYNMFTLLNELNILRVNGQPLPYEIKKEMIEEVFCNKHPKVSKKFIKNYLLTKEQYDSIDYITGIDDSIKSDLKSYRDMVNIMGEDFNEDVAENIIKWVTIFGDDNSIILKKIDKEYPDMFDEEQLNKISRLKYKDWGSLSEKLLTQIKSNQLLKDGNRLSILDSLYYTDNNLQQLLSSKYDYRKLIDIANKPYKKDVTKVSYDLLDDLYISPTRKRAVWQAIKIVDELVNVIGHEPEKIFIETLRGDKNNRNTNKNVLLKKFSKIKDKSRKWKNEIKEKPYEEFENMRVFLYYTQMGKCMYTGNDIDYSKLNTDKYNIEHIYPKSKINDNSLNNLILVEKSMNDEKEDNYPIDKGIQKKMKPIWKDLYLKKLISDKKYERLVRKTELNENDYIDYVSKNIIVSAQTTKVATDILKEIYRSTDLVYVKNKVVKEFANNNFLTLNREINNINKVKYTYLNVVVGNVYYEKLSKNISMFFKSEKGKKFSFNRVFKENLTVDGNVIWDIEKSFEVIKNTFKKNDINKVMKKNIQKGQMFNQTIVKANKVKANKSDKYPLNYYPIKTGDNRFLDVTKYGGHSDIAIAYNIIVRYKLTKSSGTEYKNRLVRMPVYVIQNSKTKEDIEDFLNFAVSHEENKGEVSDIKIVCDKLAINSLIKVDGSYFYLGGKTGSYALVNIPYELIIDRDKDRYITKIYKAYRNKYSKEYYKRNNMDSDKNWEIFKYLIDKTNTPLYSKLPRNKKYEEIRNSVSKEVFASLEMEKQFDVIIEAINILTDQYTTYDKLKHIDIKIQRMTISSDLSRYKEFEVIEKSPTGLYEKIIKIK